MKFTFTKEVLLKEMAIAQEIISNKTAISIFSGAFSMHSRPRLPRSHPVDKFVFKFETG